MFSASIFLISSSVSFGATWMDPKFSTIRDSFSVLVATATPFLNAQPIQTWPKEHPSLSAIPFSTGSSRTAKNPLPFQSSDFKRCASKYSLLTKLGFTQSFAPSWSGATADRGKCLDNNSVFLADSQNVIVAAVGIELNLVHYRFDRASEMRGKHFKTKTLHFSGFSCEGQVLFVT